MSSLTLRLPEPLDARLTQQAALEACSRSELVRLALEKFLRERERERQLAALVQAAQFLASDAAAQAASAAITAELAAADSTLGLDERNDWWA